MSGYRNSFFIVILLASVSASTGGLAATTAPAPPQNMRLSQDGTPSSQPLVQSEDLTYLGSFKLPATRSGNATFDYADDGLAYYAAHNSLFIKGHTYGQLIAESAFPAP